MRGIPHQFLGVERDHEDEAEDDRELAWLAEQQTRVSWIAPSLEGPLMS